MNLLAWWGARHKPSFCCSLCGSMPTSTGWTLLTCDHSDISPHVHPACQTHGILMSGKVRVCILSYCCMYLYVHIYELCMFSCNICPRTCFCFVLHAFCCSPAAGSFVVVIPLLTPCLCSRNPLLERLDTPASPRAADLDFKAASRLMCDVQV